MKKLIIIIFIIGSALLVNAQTNANSHVSGSLSQPKTDKIGIVIYSNDAETVWNAFRFANYSIGQGDSVSVFLLGKGVEAQDIESQEFDVKGMMQEYADNGGKILSCGTCLVSRNKEGSTLCPISSMSELYALIKSSDIVLTF